MIVLVCGGREYTNQHAVNAALSTSQPKPTIIIHGAARGADSLANNWALANDVPVRAFAANWKKHGKAAGMIRNREMLEQGKPDLIIAFAGGKGTENMCRLAKKHGVPVIQVSET